MTYRNAKTILFVSLIAAMILPFSAMEFAQAAQNEKTKRDFVAEWKILQDQVDVLREKQSEYRETMSKSIDTDEILQIAKSMDANDLKISSLIQQIDELEQESINSMKMDPKLEEKLFATEMEISKTYLGDTAVWGAYVDYELKKVVVYVDATQQNADQISNSIITQYGKDVVEIDNDLPQPTACGSQTSTCRPLIGGIELSRYSDPSNRAGTLGYKATDSNGYTGFVTAAHVVNEGNPGNIWMKQPINGGLVGYATEMHEGQGNLDTAFVRTTTSIDDDLYKGPNQVADVKYKAIASDHTMGAFLYMMGTSSGEITGTINGISSSGWYKTTMSPVSGDSGGPVYKKIGGAGGTYTIKIFGHMFSGAGIYTSVHAVTNNWGITPVT